MTKKRATPGAGSVYKDKHRPNMWIGAAIIDGKKRRVSAPTKREARERLTQLIANGPAVAPAAFTVAELLADWLARDLRDVAPSTVARHRWAVAKWTGKIGKVKVAELSVRQVEDALTAMLPMSTASVRQVRSTLSQALGQAVRREELARNVAALAQLPRGASDAIPRSSLTPEEARALLAHLGDVRNGAMFALMLKCGLRPGESAGLMWDCVAGDTIDVRRGARGRQVVDELKTKAAARVIQLPEDVAMMLRNHRVDQAAERLAASEWDDDRLVFATTSGTVVDAANMRRELRAVCVAASVRVVSPNELRHSCASYLSDLGVSHAAIADLLGHTTTRMVDTNYRHRLREVVDVAALAQWA